MNTSIALWIEWKDGSTFVSKTNKMSNLSWTISFSISSLFLKEFTFKWPMNNLLALLKNTWIIAWLTTLSGLATIMLFTSRFILVQLSYFIRDLQLFGLQPKFSRDHQCLLKVFVFFDKIDVSWIKRRSFARVVFLFKLLFL